MKIFLSIVILLVLFGCSDLTIEEVENLDERILIEEPFIINLNSGKKYEI